MLVKNTFCEILDLKFLLKCHINNAGQQQLHQNRSDLMPVLTRFLSAVFVQLYYSQLNYIFKHPLFCPPQDAHRHLIKAIKMYTRHIFYSHENICIHLKSR